MANLLRQAGAPRDRIIDHLRNSFTPGDNNFEAQFWCARELFLANRVSDSDSIFEKLNERAPGRFRTDPSAEVTGPDGKRISFDGSVSRKEEGYAFVKLVDFAVGIFASRADSARIDWDRIRTGSQIACFLAFSRKGARAVRLTRRGT
jgi:hypothetical protein